MALRVGFIGNFSAPHSTENHVARALQHEGCEVLFWQESPRFWRRPPPATDVDMVLWTTTYDYSPPDTFDLQRKFMADLQVPIVGYHLDLWWSLDREHRIHESPFFRCDLVCTADGGHDDRWDDAGVIHQWMPPAISRFEANRGEDREEFRAGVAFVGSWQGGYHAESLHRHRLVKWLRNTYGARCKFWPLQNQPAIRGRDLQDLYASTKVIVGDSCSVPNLRRYWSDRVPETLGRGGFLLHPAVEGLAEVHPDLVTWEAGDWDQLRNLIDSYLEEPDARAASTELTYRHTLAFHTYEVRMRDLIATLKERHLL